MKLDRGFSVLVAVLLAGCAASAPQQPPKPVTGTAQLMAADVPTDDDPADEMPKVGKPQHGESVADDAIDTKDAPRRHADSRPGGGFSGYK